MDRSPGGSISVEWLLMVSSAMCFYYYYLYLRLKLCARTFFTFLKTETFVNKMFTTSSSESAVRNIRRQGYLKSAVLIYRYIAITTRCNTLFFISDKTDILNISQPPKMN